MVLTETLASDDENGRNLSSLAHKAVSQMIRSKELRGGQIIVEAKLADTLGISRTPLREALRCSVSKAKDL